MADDARSVRSAGLDRVLTAGTIVAYECWQVGGKAAVYDSPTAVGSGNYVELRTTGQWTFLKTTGFEAIKGGRAYWDHSANAVNYKKVNDRDFYIGRFAEGASSGANTCVIDLNDDPPYDIELSRDPFTTTLVGTSAAGGFGYPVRNGGGAILELSATSEAQKVDLISVDGFSVDANPIIEFAFRIPNDGSNATQDFTVGAASGTHASDVQTIAEFVAVSTVGNSTNINAQSDDGITDVAPVDTTADYTEGSAVANRVEGWIDCSDKTSCKIYVNGTRVLSGTTFTLAAAVGPLFLIAHLEKTTGTDVYKVALDWLRVRYSEQ